MKKGKMLFLLGLALSTCLNINSTNYAATFFEGTDVVSGWGAINEWNVEAKSPFRSGNTGTGSEDLVRINGQFGNIRPADYYKLHNGVDLNAVNRSVFSVFDYGSIAVVNNWDGSTDGYGNYIVVQHQTKIGGVDYGFQSMYAHMGTLQYTSANVGANVSSTTKVGVSGSSGNVDAHLHLEFRTPQYSADSRGTDMYAPSTFYWRKGDWGNNTSFINHIGSGNIVQFRIVSISSGSERLPRTGAVTLFHRLEGSSTWKQTTMNQDGYYWSSNLLDLGYSVGNRVEYFVRVYKGRGNIDEQYGYVFRPYGIINYETSSTNLRYAPVDKPFVKIVSASKSSTGNLVQGMIEGEIGTLSNEAKKKQSGLLSATEKELHNINTFADVLITEKIAVNRYKAVIVSEEKLAEKFGEVEIYLDYPVEYITALDVGDTYTISCDFDGEIMRIPEGSYIYYPMTEM